MKNFLLTTFLLVAVTCWSQTPTKFTFQFFDASGQPDTNYTIMQGWPPATGSATVVSNVIVWAGASQIITNMFSGTNTIGTNSAMPNTYRVLCPATGIGFLVTIPQTTNQLPLALYATNIPVTYSSSSLYFYITNALGFQPAPATYAGIVASLGFIPATNGGVIAYSQLPFTPDIPGSNISTNVPVLKNFMSSNCLTNSFGTNADGTVTVHIGIPFQPATNRPSFITNIWMSGILLFTNGSGNITNVVPVLSTNILLYQSP